MKKKKNHVKRFAAAASSMIVLILMVAPLSVSAAGFSVESWNAHTYWNSWEPSFSASPSLNLDWYDIDAIPNAMDFMRPFDRFVPNDLKDELYVKGYFSDYPIALYGQEYNASFTMSFSFSIELKKPLLLSSGERLEFFYMPIDNRFIDSSTNTQVYFNRSSNCQMLYVDGNGSPTIPQNLYTSIDTVQNDNGFWVSKVLVENYGKTQIEVNTLQISFITNTTSTYTGVATIGMLFSNVVRIVADPDIYPDYGDIENILGSIDDTFTEWNDKQYDVEIPDYSLIVGDGNEHLEGLEGSGKENLGIIMNDFASQAQKAEVVFGNAIAQNAIAWLLQNEVVTFMVVLSCALLCTRAVFGR